MQIYFLKNITLKMSDVLNILKYTFRNCFDTIVYGCHTAVHSPRSFAGFKHFCLDTGSKNNSSTASISSSCKSIISK